MDMSSLKVHQWWHPGSPAGGIAAWNLANPKRPKRKARPWVSESSMPKIDENPAHE